MSDVRKWSVERGQIRDGDDRWVVTFRRVREPDPIFAEFVFRDDATRRQIEALPLLVAAVVCRDALRSYLRCDVDDAYMTEVLKRHGWAGLESYERLVSIVEENAMAALGGDE